MQILLLYNPWASAFSTLRADEEQHTARAGEVTPVQELVSALLAWLALAGAGLLAALALWLLVPGARRRLLPVQWQRSVPWTGFDVWIAFCVFILLPGLVHGLLSRVGLFTRLYGEVAESGPLFNRQFLWSNTLAMPAQVALILLALRALRGARAAQTGLTTTRVVPNLVAGYLVWLVLTPLVLLVTWAVTLLIPMEEHQLQQLGREPLIPAEWGLILVAALLAAPLVEELVFRGVLLPWQLNRGLDAQLIVGTAALAVALVFGVKKDQPFNPGPALFVAAMLPGYLLLPWLARRFGRHEVAPGAGENGETAQAPAPLAPPNPEADGWPGRVVRATAAYVRLASEKRARVLLAIYGNALLFAAFHSSVWPSPVPLFVLSLGLSWLAYRTQSLVGSVVVHALFNGVACVMLVLAQGDVPTRGNGATDADRRPPSASTSTAVPGTSLPRRM
jgi:membrane protease YdiL (CAAX protease family)